MQDHSSMAVQLQRLQQAKVLVKNRLQEMQDLIQYTEMLEARIEAQTRELADVRSELDEKRRTILQLQPILSSRSGGFWPFISSPGTFPDEETLLKLLAALAITADPHKWTIEHAGIQLRLLLGYDFNSSTTRDLLRRTFSRVEAGGFSQGPTPLSFLQSPAGRGDSSGPMTTSSMTSTLPATVSPPILRPRRVVLLNLEKDERSGSISVVEVFKQYIEPRAPILFTRNPADTSKRIEAEVLLRLIRNDDRLEVGDWLRPVVRQHEVLVFFHQRIPLNVDDLKALEKQSGFFLQSPHPRPFVLEIPYSDSRCSLGSDAAPLQHMSYQANVAAFVGALCAAFDLSPSSI